jgi:RHS repeat-associated protein
MSDVPLPDTVDTTYEGNGRVFTVSNPYRSTSDPTYGLTTYTYDALGRKTGEAEPDGTSQLIWSYSGPTMISTDEDGNVWTRTSDSLGRLTTVVEPTALTTRYSYNPMGDLVYVNQLGIAGTDTPRQRSFVYDSLSHLVTANNPETGTICYGLWSGGNCINGYDADGNLLAKTDARNITTNYAYDSLNRITSKTYSDSTPPANYYYDVASSNGIGRLSTATVGGANVYSEYYYQYDAVGRLQRKNFQSPNATGNGMQSNIGASGDTTYDLAGHVIFTDTGVGVYEMLTRDAGGHVVNATSNAATTAPLSGIASHNIFLNGTYTPLGGLAARTLGNGLTETRSYDKRGRQTSTTQAQAGSSIGYSVSTGYDPVGNVTSINDSVNGNWTYLYDSLNRLHQGFSAAGLDLDWEYDAFGNRKSQTPSGTGSAPQMNLPFTNPTNQVDPGNNIAYDAAGNVITDNQGQTYTYDAEERISSMIHLGGAPTVYKYDSESNLVYESGASGVQVFLRNAAGQPVTIYPPSNYTGPSPYQNIIAYVDGENIGLWHSGVFNWSGKDTVGTKRYSSWGKGDLASSTQPQLIGAFTSLPFGDALSSIGTSPIHFTGKERDTESGNDYFGARYYASSMGRWMSPDWAAKPEAVPYSDLTNPQSLNLYGYVKNNPLSKADPDGHCCEEEEPAEEVREEASFERDLSRAARQVNADEVNERIQRLNPGAARLSPDQVEAGQADAAAKIHEAMGSYGFKPPNFVATPGSDIIPIPTGASGPTPVRNDAGNVTGSEYQGGSGGGPGLNSKVTGVRIMDPTPAKGKAPAYPNGAVSYNNTSSPKNQTVNPQTGQTVPKSDPSAHIQLKPNQ